VVSSGWDGRVVENLIRRVKWVGVCDGVTDVGTRGWFVGLEVWVVEKDWRGRVRCFVVWGVNGAVWEGLDWI